MPRFVFLCGLVRTRPYSHGLIGVTLVLLAFWVTVRVLRLADPIGPQSFERLRLGMTEWEVRDAIGLPAGDYYTGTNGLGGFLSPGHWGLTLKRIGTDEKQRISRAWRGDHYSIRVGFDSRDTVVAGTLMEVYPATERESLAAALATITLVLVTLAFVGLLARFCRSGVPQT